MKARAEGGQEAKFDLAHQMQDLLKRRKEANDELMYIKAQVGECYFRVMMWRRRKSRRCLRI